MSPSTPNRPTIAAAIIVRGGKVLVVHRRVAEETLSWQFPAGAVEEGETPGQAAVRETQEETGLIVTESRVLGGRIHPDTGRAIVYVACDVKSGDATVVDDDELVGFAWSSRDELGDYVPHGLYPAVQVHLDALLR